MFQTPEPPKNDDFNDDESAEWFLSLTPAEMFAVRYYVKTGNPELVNALKFTSPRLRDMDFPPFNPADLVEVTAEMCIREIDGDASGYIDPDYSHVAKLPLHLHPMFAALPYHEQIRLRVQHWLLGAGEVAEAVGRWLLDTLDANPNADRKTLRVYFDQWTVKPKLYSPRPFHGLAHGDAARAFWYAIEDGKTGYKFQCPIKRRKPLTPAESALCEEVITSHMGALASEPDDMLSAWEAEAAAVVSAAWETLP